MCSILTPFGTTNPAYLLVVAKDTRGSWVSVKLSADIELPPSTPTICKDIVPHSLPKIKMELGVYVIFFLLKNWINRTTAIYRLAHFGIPHQFVVIISRKHADNIPVTVKLDIVPFQIPNNEFLYYFIHCLTPNQ